MVNRKGFTVVQLLVAAFVAGLLLILLVAVPNVMRQTRNSNRAQDVHVLGLLITEQRAVSSTGALPLSCDSTQSNCFAHDNSLSFYTESSNSDSLIDYHRNSKPFDDKSPQLDASEDGVSYKVLIQTFAICSGDRLTGEYASAGSISIQYAVETLRGTKLVCKTI